MASTPNPQRILITGSTRGIGQALAEHYASPGCSLLLHGRDEARLNELAARCRDRGAEVRTLSFDLGQRALQEDWRRTLTAAGTLDLVIVNAGVTSSPALDSCHEPWPQVEQVLDVNLYAAMMTVDAVLPAMRERQSGQIALISSLSAWYGLPITPAYCASKAGLKAYGEAMRGWLASEGIAVNVILPGFVKTDMSDSFPGARPFMVSAERAARIIASGLRRNRPRISFPFPLNLGMWGLAVLPAWLSQRILDWTGYGR